MTTIDFASENGPRALERLQTEQVGWLVTSGKDGVPQPTPVWFLWENDKILIFSEPNTGKTRAIKRNPQVAFHFNTNDGGDDVAVFSGTAAIVSGPSLAEIPAYREKYGEGIVHIDLTPESMASQFNQRIEITPTKLRGW